MPSAPPNTTAAPRQSGASLVAAGILLSRFSGLIRERIIAHYLGNSMPAAAFRTALRIPNFLQNLFGEGVLSASFIPVYARLLAEKDQEAADRVAGAVFGLLTLAVSILVLVGLVATPTLIHVIAPGFTGEARELTIELVRIVFPGTGLLVMSAWCLGILNSHRRFFLSYVAPVVWSGAIIVSLILGRHTGMITLAHYASWGAVVGSLLQVLVQVPTVRLLLGQFRPSLSLASGHVLQVLRSFGPVVLGRGVVQVSAYVDTAYASLISERALSALAYAQTLYLIPISLFGMAVSAAELPEMSSALGAADEVAAKLRTRILMGSRQIAFFVVPSAAAFLVLGDVIGGALLQTGHFTASDTRYLWYLLMGSTVGLAASTLGRLYSSAFYALRQPRIPLLYAALRVALTAGLAWWSAVRLPGTLGLPVELGGVGITATTGVAAWIEFVLLRRRLQQEIGPISAEMGRLARLWVAALIAVGLGLGIKVGLTGFFGAANSASEWGGGILPMPNLWTVWTAAIVLPVVGTTYLVATWGMGIENARALIKRVRSRLRV